MAELSVQDIRAGSPISPSYGPAAAGGDTFKPRASGPGVKLALHVKNGSAGSITVTVNDPNTKTPLGATAFNPDIGIVIPAGAERIALLDPISRFVDENGNVGLTYSGVTSLTIGVLRLF